MRVFLLLAVVFVGSCAAIARMERRWQGAGVKTSYERRMQSWVGRSHEELMMTMGIPTQTVGMPSGGLAILYASAGSPTAIYHSRFNVLTTHQSWCETTFFADAKGTIVSWRFEGNGCR